MVLGTGAVGLSAVMAANLVGAYPIIAVDINDDRLALALELGATHTFNPKKDDVVAKVRELVPRGLRFAFDTSGVPASWATAIRSLCMGGTFGGAAMPVGRDLGFGYRSRRSAKDCGCSSSWPARPSRACTCPTS